MGSDGHILISYLLFQLLDFVLVSLFILFLLLLPQLVLYIVLFQFALQLIDLSFLFGYKIFQLNYPLL